MSYNVRLLNLYDWIDDDAIPEKFKILSNKPLQIFYPFENTTVELQKKQLIHMYLIQVQKQNLNWQFSKFPFLNTEL